MTNYVHSAQEFDGGCLACMGCDTKYALADGVCPGGGFDSGRRMVTVGVIEGGVRCIANHLCPRCAHALSILIRAGVQRSSIMRRMFRIKRSTYSFELWIVLHHPQPYCIARTGVPKEEEKDSGSHSS